MLHTAPEAPTHLHTESSTISAGKLTVHTLKCAGFFLVVEETFNFRFCQQQCKGIMNWHKPPKPLQD